MREGEELFKAAPFEGELGAFIDTLQIGKPRRARKGQIAKADPATPEGGIAEIDIAFFFAKRRVIEADISLAERGVEEADISLAEIGVIEADFSLAEGGVGEVGISLAKSWPSSTLAGRLACYS